MDTKESFKRAFDEAYGMLNEKQKEAVDTIDGPVMVVAGPGTGKTQVLTLRIANILLQTDTAPESILALTFTDSGAQAMRERLRRYLGARAYQVRIFTFHGFAQQLIAQYPDFYPKVIGSRPASDVEKIHIIESILQSKDISLLSPLGNPSYYVYHVMRMIGQLKQEYVSPDQFAELIAAQETELEGIEKIHQKGAHKGKVRGEYTKKEKSIGKNKELLLVYRQYEALLSDAGLYDFEDMIVETVTALSTQEDMLRDLQEQYQYILADEHQDVNGSQNKILELLSSYHTSPNIFVVGDEKQAIYRFQGASLENFLFFQHHHQDVKVISLVDNYRSGQPVLDAAHSLIEVADGPLKELRLPLHARAVDTAVVEMRSFSHQAIEDDWLAEQVVQTIESGVPAQEVAVIVRTNREVEELTGSLRKAGVSVTASADGDILRHPITLTIKNIIEVVVNAKNEQALFSLLHAGFWEFSLDDVFKVLSARSYDTSLWSIISSVEKLNSLSLDDSQSFLKVAELVTACREKASTQALQRVLEYMLQASGFLGFVMKNDPLEGIRVIRRLYDEIEELVVRGGVQDLSGILQLLETRMEYGLPLNAPYIVTDCSSVQVMTAHKSKGLEFEVVFIPHLTDKAWSGAAKKKYFDITLSSYQDSDEHQFIEDERRLLYVAFTRAKSQLYVSHAKVHTDGKELIAARLLEEIDEQYMSSVSSDAFEKTFSMTQSLEQSMPTIKIDPKLLHTVVLERGFSATSLNNYLRSPWDYLYRNVLRIPETQPAHMQYGTAVHNTLEYVTRYHTSNGSFPNEQLVKNKLETELQRLPLTEDEYHSLREKGIEELFVYLGHLHAVLPPDTKEELTIKVWLPTGIPELPEVKLTGKLDRIDLNERKEAVRVVDYKTGKPKSRNVIEGNTKDSDGGYKRQLVFYALLLDLYDDKRFKTNIGTLSFVQPTPKGDVKEEQFTIEESEIESLKEEIIQAVADILDGSFLRSPCNENESDYCQYVSQLFSR